MDCPPTLTLHIGIPKTASTWLQEVVFPQLEDIVFCPTPANTLFHSAEDTANRLMASCVRRSSRVWEQYGDAIFADLFGDKQLWLRHPKNALVSDESFGRHGSRPEHLQSHLIAIAAKARQWGFGSLRIICLFRRQDQWLASHYAQMSNRDELPSQEGFERLVEEVVDPARSRYMLGMLLDYSALDEALSAAVGRSNVMMMPYEMLASNERQFREKLLTFLDLPPQKELKGREEKRDEKEEKQLVNQRRSGQTTWQLRAPLRSGWRRKLGSAARKLGIAADAPRTITLTPAATQRVLQAYDDSNRRLQHALDLDLAQYGYLGGPASD